MLLLAISNGVKGLWNQSQALALPAGSDKKEVCDLLSKEEIESVLGQSVDKGIARSDIICEYRSSTARRSQPSALLLTIRLDYANKAPQEALETYHMVMKIGLGDQYKPEAVSGIGDLAIWDKHVGGLVTFKSMGESKSAMITVKPETMDGQKAQDAAKALAQIALGKL